MKWFYNLKIGAKLILAFLLVSSISVIIVWLGIKKLQGIAENDKNMYEKCLLSVQNLGTASSSYELAMALTRDVVLEMDGSGKNFIEERNALTAKINQSLKAYEETISTPEEKELYNDFVEKRKTFRDNIAIFNKYIINKQKKEAANFFQGDFINTSQAQRDALQKLINYKQDYANKLNLNNQEEASDAIRNMIILAIAGFIISVGLGLFIAKIIKNPIMKVLNMADELKKGHVNVRANIDTKDELGLMGSTLDQFAGQLEGFAELMKKISYGDVSVSLPPYDKDDKLAPAMNLIAETLRNLVKEIDYIINGAIQGKLSIRGNADKFNGGYKDIVTGINNTLDAIIGPLNMAAEYVDRISKGDIPAKITEEYKGDFNEIKNNLNGCIDAVNFMIKDIGLLSKAAYDGNLKLRADETKHSGDFRKIVAGVNTTMDTVTGPLNAASECMDNISKGVLPEPIQEEYRGDYLVIKTAINNLIQTTGLIFKGVHRISLGIIDGNLEDRGNPSRVPGSWSELVVDINSIIEMLVSNIKLMAKNINAISKGDIPETITEKYKGDYELIKNDLNTCSLSIKSVIDDINSLAGEAIKGNLNVRADALKHSGDFKKIVEGVNNTLEAVVTPIKSAANYIELINEGKLNEPINEEFKGDFNQIKNNLNGLIETIVKLFMGVDRMTNNITNGNLDDTGKPEIFKGSWFKVANGISSMLIALREPIRFMESNIKKISNGEIPERITTEYKGEFNEVKENLNTCFESINALINDMKQLSDNAVNGKLKDRADVSKHKGDYGKIILGVNNTLDAILAPIREAVTILEAMANGDLTVRIESDFKGDHGLIKNSINSVANSLNQALSNVSEAVATTASASGEISSSTDEMAAGAGEQTRQIAEIASGIEEMTRTILENTKNAAFAADTAKKAGDKAVDGGKVVKETIEGMTRIAEVVKKSAETVRELGKSSDQIGEIIQVIDDIADQTNLLALNAAIEAARAGEQGRGFAVVADEVRKLAERTTKATKEIASMIKQIQKDTENAVQSMEVGTSEVEVGRDLTNKAGTSLQEIVDESQHVVEIVTQVAAASEQQSTAAEEISKNIESISSVTQQSAAGTEQIAKAAEDLSRLTLNLENLVGQFKIEEQSSQTKLNNRLN